MLIIHLKSKFNIQFTKIAKLENRVSTCVWVCLLESLGTDVVIESKLKIFNDGRKACAKCRDTTSRMQVELKILSPSYKCILKVEISWNSRAGVYSSNIKCRVPYDCQRKSRSKLRWHFLRASDSRESGVYTDIAEKHIHAFPCSLFDACRKMEISFV